MEDFCNKMQLMNATGYQGIFEAAGHKLNDIGGVMLWKLNAAFPSVVWQVYDWYLMPNAGYYFMQNSCEPVHIQLNPVNHKVMVINRTYKQVSGLKAVADVYSFDSKSVFHEVIDVSLGSTDIKETSSLDQVLKDSGSITFVVLNLRNSEGKVVSHNVYWFSPGNEYKALEGMKLTSLYTSVTGAVKGETDHTFTIQVVNNTDRIAFFVRPQIVAEDEEILPSFWSQNYFTLAPGENTRITVTCPATELKGKKPVLKVSGWNVSPAEISLP